MRTAPQKGISEIWLIGPIGTSKTYGAAYALSNIAFQFPGSFIPVGRTTLADARLGTVGSFWEILDDMQLQEDKHFRFVGGMEVKFMFNNGSVIQFLGLDNSKDREWRKLKSINATASMIDEVDSVLHDGYTMFTSRVGRKNKNGAPAVSILTCNPADNWVKDNIYDPWKKGELPPDKMVIEFVMQDSFLYASGFYDRYKNNPPQWKERYLNNNWNYQDDEGSLFKMRMLDNILVKEYDHDAEQYVGLDVAREGKDRSVIARIAGDTLVDIQIKSRDMIESKAKPGQRDAPPYGPILGGILINYCYAHGVGYQKTAVDEVGNGAGVVDYCRDNDFKVNGFKAGSSPTGKPSPKDKRGEDISTDYDMLRSQMYHQLSLAMEKGEFKFLDSCPHLTELKQELQYHQYKIEDKVMKVEKKEEIKKRLGKSPDIADAVIMAYFNKRHVLDPRHDTSRLAW